MSYQTEYQQSIEQPEAFWAEKAQALDWITPPKTILSKNNNGMDVWFADGQLNTCHLALDANINKGRGEQVAIYYDSPVTNSKKAITYNALKDEVALLAGVLKANGVSKGDRVLVYMPMIPQTIVAMLACARLGAIHCVVFGGFAARELAVRIDDATPKVIVSASCGIEVKRIIEYKPMLDEAIELATHKPQTCVILQRSQSLAPLIKGRDIDYDKAIKTAMPADCVSVKSTDPLYILYTSGTTGKPKGIVRENGGHAVAMHYSMKSVYDLNPGEVFWAASDVGWVVGHSYIVYAPLLSGLTTVLYEGKPVGAPDAGAFWRIISQYQVKAIFTAPTAFRAIKKVDPDAEHLKKYDISCLKQVFLAGERLDPPTYHWLYEKTGLPVLDHWWQTETGWAICANPTGIEAKACKAGSSTVPSPGFNVYVLDDNSQPVGPNEHGSLAVKLPLPPSVANTIWQSFQRFELGYLQDFPGYYCSGDGGYIDEDGYVFIMGRTDDVINVAGHRLSTGEIEEIVSENSNVAECAVIGIRHQLKGQVPIGFVILKDGIKITDDILQAEIVASVRKNIGAFACFTTVIVVAKLPKTRSGKILRKLMRQIVDEIPYEMPPTIEDPDCIDELIKHKQQYSSE